MGTRMRRLIRFPCDDLMLSGSLDEGELTTGLLLVTGGSQVRAGPHRMLHQLAAAAAEAGYPAFRYERRGVGDSDGDDSGYRDSGADLIAAATAFRAEALHIETIVGFGLCDGATTLALHGRRAGIDALALANPWLVEVEPGELAPAATRVHYRKRLTSPAAWAGVLRGKVDLLGAARSLFGLAAKSDDASLADEVAERLAPYAGKLMLILATGDNTAITAKSCWNAQAFAGFRGERIVEVDTDAHTFARPDDLVQVQAAILGFIRDIHEPV